MHSKRPPEDIPLMKLLLQYVSIENLLVVLPEDFHSLKNVFPLLMILRRYMIDLIQIPFKDCLSIQILLRVLENLLR